MKTLSILLPVLLLAGCGNTAPLPSTPNQLPLPSDAQSDELRRGDAACKTQREVAHVAVQIDDLPLLVKPLSNAVEGRSNVVSVIALLRARGRIPTNFSAIVIMPEMQPIVQGTNIVLELARHVEEDLHDSGATQVVYHCFIHYGFWVQLYPNGLPALTEKTERVE
jgi:hypothetical protein